MNLEFLNFQDWGTVIGIDITRQFPIIVLFDSGNTESFTLDGRYELHEMQALSFTEYDLVKGGFSQERPEMLPERGSKVWVRNGKYRSWRIAYFVQKLQEGPYYYECSNYINLTGVNYYKFMTTENPYNND